MAGREPTDRAFEDVSAVVEEAAGLALIGAEAKGVSAHMELAEGLPPALINRTQVQQVVLNLVRNGVDALEESDVRQLAVATAPTDRSEEHTSELQSLMRISYAVFCLKKKKTK